MSWVALLLIGVGLTDLAHSALHRSTLPAIVGAAGAVGVGLLAGLTGGRDLVALVVIALVVIAWGRSVTHAFGRDRAWLPLTLLAVAVLAAIACSPLAAPTGGQLQHWLEATPLPLLAGRPVDQVLLVTGGLLVQMTTGNVVVRLVLAATGTISPLHFDDTTEQEQRLKGGRLLGPMERLVIFCLGLSGYLTAASVVVAAKGLLRFPELSSRSDQERIHLLTEYFLVGSFASWLVALGALLLTRT